MFGRPRPEPSSREGANSWVAFAVFAAIMAAGAALIFVILTQVW